MSRVAFISTYPPRRCGIGTYTEHLRQSLNQSMPHPLGHPVVVLTNPEDKTPEHPLYWLLPTHRRESYREMAQRLNQSDVSVVSLQHEFGIFGGDAGEFILELTDALKKPLVTTFHTVFEVPEQPYWRVQQALVERSDALVVMSPTAVNYLRKAFAVPAAKLVYIPHGAPVPVAKQRAEFREQLGWNHLQVVLTFGLLNRGKGIELILRALPQVVNQVHNLLYVVAGQTHPGVLRYEGEAYRRELVTLAQTLGVTRHMQMMDQYFTEEDLVHLITSCDLYVTPYPGMTQITSGTLAYAVGLGRPVLSTPYVYAKDLLKDHPEWLISYKDTAVWVEQLTRLFTHTHLLERQSQEISRIGRGMQWPQVAQRYTQIFRQAEDRRNTRAPIIDEGKYMGAQK
ncbi:glycosyltransferase [Alicyclobacillaceae bacterium I2511]|nr:glycosyltransferase [Alicyclobacillaceae bacterium I2511]